MLSPEAVEQFFTRQDGQYFCARWGRPIAPVVFGVEDQTLATVRAAFEALCQLAGHQMADTDPELGSNLMLFFFRDWDELPAVPGLDRLIEGLEPLVARLKEADANQYRVFRFDDAGAIKACFVFVRMDAEMAAVPADTIALSQAVQSMVVWSDRAFTDRSALGTLDDGRVVLKPDVAALIRAVYDPVMPAMATDPAHALRIAARLEAGQAH